MGHSAKIQSFPWSFFSLSQSALGCSSVPYLLYKRVVLLFLFHRSLEPADCCYPPKRIDEEVLPIMECKSKSGNPSIVREGSAHPSGAKRWCISESLRNQVYPRVVNPVVYLNCLVDVNPGLVLSNRVDIGVVPLSYKVGRLFPSKNRIPRPTLQESYLRRQNPEGNSESFHRYLPSLLRWVYPGF